MKHETWRTWFFAVSITSLGLLSSLVACADDKLHKAAYYGNVDQVRALLEQGNLDRDERDSSGGTPLHAAMFQKNTEIVRLLIEHGFDVNAVGPKNGYTPLHDAVWARNPEAAAMLLKYGARTDVKGKDGLTPYEKALKENKPEMVRVLTPLGNLHGP
jgi:ankyrin repeat protein